MRPVVGGKRHLRHLEKTIDFPFACEIHDTMMGQFQVPDAFRVFINSNERETVSNQSEEIIDNADAYDLILTVDRNVLKRVKHAVNFPFGGSWIYPTQPNTKEFSVSFLLSSVDITPIHRMRRVIWERQNEIKIPRRFYLSVMRPPTSTKNLFARLYDRLRDRNRPLPSGDKLHLFNSTFSICPENWAQRGYFTEKIVDCFVTRTIPLYLGCTDIGDYFDANGIIFFDNPDHLIRIVNKLTPEYYHCRAQSIETNYFLALEYVDFDGRLRSKILESYERDPRLKSNHRHIEENAVVQ